MKQKFYSAVEESHEAASLQEVELNVRGQVKVRLKGEGPSSCHDDLQNLSPETLFLISNSKKQN